MALLHYRELVVWRKSLALVTDVYRLTAHFPNEETYGLKSRIRRAAVSVPANIAEGQGRWSRGEFRQFLGHARGSLFELETHVLIAQNLEYVSGAESAHFLTRIHEVGRLLNGLLKSLERTDAA
jgi:four helix bundle protein